MFEPGLPHNREEYERLGRQQIGVLIAAPFVVLAFLLVLVAISPPSWTQWLLLPLVFLGIGIIGVLEIRKTLVYRRDLRERRDDRT